MFDYNHQILKKLLCSINQHLLTPLFLNVPTRLQPTQCCIILINIYVSKQCQYNVIQYNCAKAVLKLQSTPARIAILSDLGWVPVLDHLDGLRLNYFNYLCQMDDDKMAKNVFNGLWEHLEH